jgi:hypothetical protein
MAPASQPGEAVAEAPKVTVSAKALVSQYLARTAERARARNNPADAKCGRCAALWKVRNWPI